jgi:quinol monooxygenase YgiN
LEGFEFTRPEVATHPDPFLVFTDIEYKPGKVETVIPFWKGVFERTRDDEKGALYWQLARDSMTPYKVFIAHAYES